MDERDLYWLAGLLEGEGSFVAGPPSSPNRPRIQISMTDQDVVERVAAFFGIQYIQVRRQGKEGQNWKTAYNVFLRGKRAIALMKILYPLMGKRRRKQIEHALASYDPYKHCKNTAKLSESQVLEIYRRAHAGERHHLIAAEFGVNRTTVTDIKRGKSWWWLTGVKAE
jgi:hypothetical protein